MSRKQGITFIVAYWGGLFGGIYGERHYPPSILASIGWPLLTMTICAGVLNLAGGEKKNGSQ